MHLPAGYDWTNIEGRKNRLRGILDQVKNSLQESVDGTMILGDFNMRDAEEEDMKKIIRAARGKKEECECAHYSEAASWNPRVNRFQSGMKHVSGLQRENGTRPGLKINSRQHRGCFSRHVPFLGYRGAAG